MITFVPYEYSHLIEEELRPLFEKAVAFNGYTTSDDYLKHIEDKSHQLWIKLSEDREIIFYFMTTITEKLSGDRVLTVSSLASYDDNKNLSNEFAEEVLDELDNFAFMNNCKSIQIEGRRGWKKILSPYGYKETSVTLTKKV